MFWPSCQVSALIYIAKVNFLVLGQKDISALWFRLLDPFSLSLITNYRNFSFLSINCREGRAIDQSAKNYSAKFLNTNITSLGRFHKCWAHGANHRDSSIKVGCMVQIALVRYLLHTETKQDLTLSKITEM